MNDIDQKIRAALQQEDAQWIEHLQGEQSLREMITETFRGRHRWLFMAAFVMPFLFIVMAFVCGYQFFVAESVRGMIGWATGVLWAVTGTGMFKLMYMMEMNKNAVTREIKRLELELANLSQRLNHDAPSGPAANSG